MKMKRLKKAANETKKNPIVINPMLCSELKLAKKEGSFYNYPTFMIIDGHDIDDMPFDEALKILAENGLILKDEDGSEWVGWPVGCEVISADYNFGNYEIKLPNGKMCKSTCDLGDDCLDTDEDEDEDEY